MSFTRPSLESIVARVRGDIRDALEIAAILRRSTEEAFAIGLAGASHVLHGHIRFISKQIFPDQAEVQFLERWAAVWQIARKAKTFANIQIAGTGTNTTVIPVGTAYQRSDGVTYTTDTEQTIAAGVFSVAITADVAGADGNIDDGEGISLLSPISGVDSAATVTTTNTEAEDVETDTSLRVRVLDRIRNPPSGGTITDYLTYAKEVAGVTRAWVVTSHPATGFNGEGGVGVYFVEDEEVPIIPSPAKVAEVQTNIDIQKPVPIDAQAFAPVANVIDMTINLKPNTATVQAAVTAELTDLFKREGQVSGATDPAKIAGGVKFSGGLSLSKINESISVAAGEEDHILVSPTADIVSTLGLLITLGTITYGTLA